MKKRYSIHIIINDSVKEKCISTTRLGLEAYIDDAEHVVIELLKRYEEVKTNSGAKLESTLEFVKKNLDNHFDIQGLDVEAVEYMKAVSKKIDEVLGKKEELKWVETEKK